MSYCGIVKFTTNIDAEITITGMKNKVTLNINPEAADTYYGFTSSIEGTGEITLHRESNTERWVILLSRSAVTTATASAPGGYATESAFTVPAVTSNLYNNTGVPVTLVANYVFSVSSTKTVYFSSGNLQYNANEPTNKWRFAENQWDICQSTAGEWNTFSWVDLFGWGTGNDPLKTSDNNEDYATFNDWGNYCGDPTGNSYTWYTLSQEEWQYLFEHSTYGMAKVEGVNGIIILPDNSSLSINTSHNAWDNNTISESVWNGTYKTAGAVFLPAAGYRWVGTDVLYVGDYGIYWSSTPIGEDFAGYVHFINNDVYPSYPSYRFSGQSVRLVCNAE